MKTQLHVTGLESLAMCGIAYERRYVRGEKVPPSASSVRGTAVHRSVDRNLRNKLESAAPIPLEQARDEARDSVVREWENGVRLTEEDREEGLDRDKVVDTSVALAGLHHGKVAPMIQPAHVARKFVLDVDGLDIQLVGEIDIQTVARAGRKVGRIRDTKTRAKSPNKSEVDESLQLSGYALAVKALDGELPESVGLDVLVRTPARGDLKFVPLDSIRGPEHLDPVLARLEHMAMIMKSGVFTPAPIGAWWCSRKFCPYHDTCRFAARPVSVPVPDLAPSLVASIATVRK